LSNRRGFPSSSRPTHSWSLDDASGFPDLAISLRGTSDDYCPWKITEEVAGGCRESDCIEKRRRGNELRREGRLYAHFSIQRRRSAPNSLIIVPCRAGKKRKKWPHADVYSSTYTKLKAEEPVYVPVGADRSLINRRVFERFTNERAGRV